MPKGLTRGRRLSPPGMCPHGPAKAHIEALEAPQYDDPMKYTFMIPLLLGCFSFGLFPSIGEAKVRPITLEKLHEDKDIEIGCGCAVLNQRDDYLVFSQPEHDAPATVRIDGQKRSLRWVSSNEGSGAPKLGDTFYRSYRDGSTKMRINYKTNFVCGPSDDSCEVTRYKVDILLQQGARRNHLYNLKGECGC